MKFEHKIYNLNEKKIFNKNILILKFIPICFIYKENIIGFYIITFE